MLFCKVSLSSFEKSVLASSGMGIICYSKLSISSFIVFLAPTGSNYSISSRLYLYLGLYRVLTIAQPSLSLLIYTSSSGCSSLILKACSLTVSPSPSSKQYSFSKRRFGDQMLFNSKESSCNSLFSFYSQKVKGKLSSCYFSFFFNSAWLSSSVHFPFKTYFLLKDSTYSCIAAAISL